MAGSSWLTGLDVHDWALNQMNRELKLQVDRSKKNILEPLMYKQQADATSLNTYGQLQNLISAFQTSIGAVSSAFAPTFSVSSSNTNVAVMGTPGSGMTAGSHTLTVTQLAQAGSIASQNFAAGSITSALNISETLNISVGSANFSVPVNTTDSIESIVNNINIGAAANGVGVTASYVTTSTGNYQIVIASNLTGVANAVVVNETNITSGSSLNITTPGGGGSGGAGTVLTAALDAQFTFDNLAYDQASNSVSIQGINFTLAGLGSNVQIVSTQTNSTSGVTTAIQNMLTAYNQIDTLIETAQAQSDGTPDPSLSFILKQLQAVMNSTVGSGTYTSLASIGIGGMTPQPITIQDTDGNAFQYTVMGNLQIMPAPTTNPPTTVTLFNNAITNNFSQVQTLLSGANGILTNISTLLTPASGSVSKTINTAVQAFTQDADDVAADIQAENNRIKQLKDDLILKYAKLELSLSKLQTTSQMIAAQIANKGG